jgi:hypothetical protein
MALALLGTMFAVLSHADVPSFRISQVFSTIDGTLQFVRLTEMEGRDDQNKLAGLTLTFTQGNLRRTYTFSRDLPTTRTAHMSFVVAASSYGKLPVVNGGTSYNDGVAYNCCYRPDYNDLPIRFVATDGGTLDFAGVDEFTYASLPTDGLNALYRDGSIRRAALPGGCLVAVGCQDEFQISLAYVGAIEYYNAALDHYFLTASAPDIDALDSGRSPGWQRTGQRFFIAGMANGYPGLDKPVCRFYMPPGHGNSHFLSALPEECAAVRETYPDFILESPAAFWVALPDPLTTQCGPDLDFNGLPRLLPMYRLWNGRADSNHRYTTSDAVRDEMIARGYVYEGVAMCVP